MDRHRFAEVALSTPLRRTFDYLIPQTLDAAQLQSGSRVLVPFGRSRKTIAIIISTKSQSDIPANKLKPILECIDKTPVFSAEDRKFIHWASRYYQHPLGEVYFNALPVKLKEGDKAELPEQRVWQINVDSEKQQNRLQRAPKQAELYHFIAEHAAGIHEAILKQHPSYDSRLMKILNDKELIYASSTQASSYIPDPAVSLATDIQLTEEQQQASDAILSQQDHFHCHLLFGITGSGKTEVYLELMQKVVARSKQVLFLVPEIGLVPQLLKAIQQRLQAQVHLYHSNMTDKERLQTWLKARDGTAQIILGTRSAIWLPMSDAGLIVMDEEHDQSYKQQEGFRYSARDLAIVKARNYDFPIVLGSATPSLESIANLSQEHFSQHQLTKRISKAKPPQMRILDIRASRMQSALSNELVHDIRETLDRGEQVLLFLNRRGFAPALLCHQCGWGAICDRCDSHMTYHKNLSRLWCHHCDRQIPVPKSCPSCEHGDIIEVGHGTERLEQELQQRLGETQVIRIDRDSTRKKDSLSQYLQTIHSGAPCVLIGTQMLSKGHHFPNVTLVGIIDVDSALYSNDFRATERLAQLIEQVSGRAGRGEKPGTVILQTHHPDNPALNTILKSGYAVFSEMMLEERRLMQLPPYRYFAILRSESHHKQDAEHFLAKARNIFHTQDQRVQLVGPLISPIEKRRGRYRMQLLIHSDSRGLLNRTLSPWLRALEDLSESRKVRWSIDIDPIDTL